MKRLGMIGFTLASFVAMATNAFAAAAGDAEAVKF